MMAFPPMRILFLHISSFIILALGLCSCGKPSSPSGTKGDRQNDSSQESIAAPIGKNEFQPPQTSAIPPPGNSRKEAVRIVRNDDEFKRTVHELIELLHQSGQKSHLELIEATSQGDAKKFNALVHQGLDVNVSNQDGRTILMDAVEVEYLNFVRVLIRAGADVNAKDKDGKTALQIALAKNNPEIIQLLKEAGAK